MVKIDINNTLDFSGFKDQIIEEMKKKAEANLDFQLERLKKIAEYSGEQCSLIYPCGNCNQCDTFKNYVLTSAQFNEYTSSIEIHVNFEFSPEHKNSSSGIIDLKRNNVNGFAIVRNLNILNQKIKEYIEI